MGSKTKGKESGDIREKRIRVGCSRNKSVGKANRILEKGAGRNELLEDEGTLWGKFLFQENGHSEGRRAFKMPDDESDDEKIGVGCRSQKEISV